MESLSFRPEINILTLNPKEQGPYHCGLCGQNGSISYTIAINYLPCDLYERMAYEGWIRNGKKIYKRIIEKCCCKTFETRVKVSNFKINKKQRKIMRKFRKFLAGKYPKSKEKNLDNININENTEKNMLIQDKKYEDNNNKNEKKSNDKKDKNINNSNNDKLIDIYSNKIDEIIKLYVENKCFAATVEKIAKEIIINVDFIYKNIKTKMNTSKNLGDYSNNIFILIMSYLKNQIKSSPELQSKNIDIKNNEEIIYKELFESFDKFYQDNFLKNSKENDLLFLFNISFKTGHLNFQVKNQEEYKLFISKYFNNKNNNNNNTKNVKAKNKDNVKAEKKIEYYNLEYFDELVPEPKIELPLKNIYTIEITDNTQCNNEKFELYDKYQAKVHKSYYSDFMGYDRFIGTSNLKSENNSFINKIIKDDKYEKVKNKNIFPTKYGSYNMLHRINGKLIAVNVFDLLPHLYDSVYCYYDTDYCFLNLGVFTGIRELEYIKFLNSFLKEEDQITYYSMGYYIPNCQKMLYKNEFEPFEVRDCYTGEFVLYDKVRNKMNEGQIGNWLNDNLNMNYYWLDDEINDYLYNLSISCQDTLFDFSTFMEVFINDDKKQLVIQTMTKLIEMLGKEFAFEFNYVYVMLPENV